MNDLVYNEIVATPGFELDEHGPVTGRRHYPDALTPRQVQEMLGIGQRMTYDLLREGKIQSVRMGRLYRVPKSAVIDYLYSEEKT